MSEDILTETKAKHTLFPNSQRVYIEGSRPDLQVPMREIELSATRHPDGAEEENRPVRVYDTAGSWGDPGFHGDPTIGLPRQRADWILERGDVEAYEGRESAKGRRLFAGAHRAGQKKSGQRDE